MSKNTFKSQSTTWSLTVRLTHWLVALGVTINFINDTGHWHRMIGYVCLLLIVMRLMHAVTAKNQTSRFYWPGMTEILTHITGIKRREATVHNGHNPLGQIAVYLMWVLITLLALTGWLSRTDALWGGGPVLVHALISYLLLACVSLHVIAVLVMSKLMKRNLIKPMIISVLAEHQPNKQ